MNNWNKINICAFKDVAPENNIPPLNKNVLVLYSGINQKIITGYFMILSNRLTFFASGQKYSYELPQYWQGVDNDLSEAVKNEKNREEKKNIEEKIEWLKRKIDEKSNIINSLREEIKQYE